MCSVCSVPSSPRPWSWPAGRRADDPGGGRDGQRSQVECRDVRLPPRRVQHVPARPAVEDLRRARRPDHHPVRREPHHRLAWTSRSPCRMPRSRSRTAGSASTAASTPRHHLRAGLELPGGDTQGASTLTQQFVKITLQENALRNNDKEAAQAAVEKMYTRKLQELKYAITLEKQLTKDQILEGYLNPRLLRRPGLRGRGGRPALLQHHRGQAHRRAVGAAGRPGAAAQQDRPDPQPERAWVRGVVLDRMHGLGMITDKELKAAKAIPVKKMLDGRAAGTPSAARASRTSASTSSPTSSSCPRSARPSRADQEDQPGRPDDPDDPGPGSRRWPAPSW